jgi:hypothetical protein
MKYNIQKWGNLERAQQTQNYDFGGILSSAVSGAATGTSVLPGWGTIAGAGIGLIGGLFNNKKQKEAKKLQDQQMKQQEFMQKQAQLLSMPQSGGGLPSMMALGGYLSPELLAKSGIHIKKSHEGRFTAYKKRTGKTTEEALHSKNPHVRQMANFARNAAKWKHELGGYEEAYENDSEPMYLANDGAMIPYALGGPDDPPTGLNAPAMFTPSDKTQWYPQSAALSKYKDLMGSGKSKEAEDLIFGYYSNEPYGPYQQGTHSEYEKAGRIKSMRARDLIGLDKTKYQVPKDYDALMQTVNTNPSVKADMTSQQFQNVTLKMAKGGFVNPLATQYNGLVRYGSGGTHNQNPLGGIPLGQSMSGKQNSVEQGETSFKFDKGKYIFSNRLRLGK